MKITPLDIRRKEFKRSMRGYSDEEVDVFLDEVADEFERIFQENVELRERLQRFEEQMAGHAQIKEALEKTLVSAQLQADETRANARKESELILRDAELKARDIVSDSYKETQQVQQALIQLKHLEEDFRFKFRSLLEGHLKLLNEAPISASAQESAVLEGMDFSQRQVHAPGSTAGEASQGAPAPTAGPAPTAAPAPTLIPVAAPATPEPALETKEAGTGGVPGSDPQTARQAPPQAASMASESVPRAPEPEKDAAQPASAFAAADQAEARARVEKAQAERKDAETPKADGLEAGFFFGRRLEDPDDVFLDVDATKNKARDFEW